MRTLQGSVVVVTGASSGLGREIAVQFALRRCAVVLAARRLDALEETAKLCRNAGGSALVVVTDVTQEEDVKMLADAAHRRWGHIDVWVNNAGVTLFAPLEAAPFDEHRRVIETNLFGPMYAARAVVPIFRRQRRGVLINVGSVLSKIGQSYSPSYVISKFALRGLSEALRAELAEEPDVHVCSIFPYAIDTQHFETGANRLGRQVHPMPPLQSPEKIARAIVDLAEHPRRELHVPRSATIGLALHRLLPRTTERLLLHVLSQWHLSNTPESQHQGNLFRPSDDQPTIRGTRPPQITTPRLVAWIARNVVRIQAQSVRRRWLRRPRRPRLAAVT